MASNKIKIPRHVLPNITPLKLPVQGFHFHYSQNVQIDVNAYWIAPRKCLLKAQKYIYFKSNYQHQNTHITCYFGNPELEYVWKIPQLTDKYKDVVELPFEIKPVNLNRVQKIPKHVYQTNKTNVLQDDLKEIYKSLRRKNPEYEFHFYDDQACRDFLLENYGQTTLQCFDNLVPGAFKADLWRYAALYKFGGIYMDMDLVPIAPFREIIDPEADTILANDSDFCKVNYLIYQAFFACKPGDPIIKEVLEKCIHNVINQNYGCGTLDITGPVMFGRQVKRILKLQVGKSIPSGNFDLKGQKIIIFEGNGNYILNFCKRRIFRYKLLNTFNASPYYKQWIMGEVFADKK